MNIFARCWYSRDETSGVKTIAQEDLGELTKEEKELTEEQWSDFKSDVSMKSLIKQIDDSVKRRRRLYYHEDADETAKMVEFRKQYRRYKPLKLIALTLYLLLPIMEKPGWCVMADKSFEF